MDLVAFCEQKLGQVGAVLAGDAGDESRSVHMRRAATSLRVRASGGRRSFGTRFVAAQRDGRFRVVAPVMVGA